VLFKDLISRSCLVRFLDFENRSRFFADVDSRFRFSLVTLSSPVSSDGPHDAEFGWLLHSLGEISENGRLIRLSARDLSVFNPNSHTSPVFTSQRELDLARVIYANGEPLYVDKGTKFAQIEFLGELFNLTRDSRLFLPRAVEREIATLPLYEAKYLHQYDHRFGTVVDRTVIAPRPELKADPNFLTMTASVVSEMEVRGRYVSRSIVSTWLCRFRDIASATNERTAIMAVFPVSAVGNSINLILGLSAKEIACLVANVNSFIFDFCCRQKIIGTHVNIWIMKQLPTVRMERFTSPCEWSYQENFKIG
jgi:hypothetical protein